MTTVFPHAHPKNRTNPLRRVLLVDQWIAARGFSRPVESERRRDVGTFLYQLNKPLGKLTREDLERIFPPECIHRATLAMKAAVEDFLRYCREVGAL